MHSKLPFLLGFLPQRISLRTPISLWVPALAAGPWGQRLHWHHPSLPWVMLTTPPTLPPWPGAATCQVTHWPPWPPSHWTWWISCAGLGPLSGLFYRGEIYFPEVSEQENTSWKHAKKEAIHPGNQQDSFLYSLPRFPMSNPPCSPWVKGELSGSKPCLCDELLLARPAQEGPSAL